MLGSMNYLGLWFLYHKEVRRCLASQIQTIWAPAVSMGLFLTVVVLAMKSENEAISGVPFIKFVTPGLMTMAIMQNSFAGAAFTLPFARSLGILDDYICPPLSDIELTIGIVGCAVTRGVLVGLVVACGSLLWPGVLSGIQHPWTALWFVLMAALMLALLGFITSLIARENYQIFTMINFVIHPLSFLSGAFFTASDLPEPLSQIMLFNPLHYAVTGVRYGVIDFWEHNNIDPSIMFIPIGILILNMFLFTVGIYLVSRSRTLIP